MREPAPHTQPSAECRESAYAATEGTRVGRLIWCAVVRGRVSRVFDMFVGSGCSAATAAAAMSARAGQGAEQAQRAVVIGFEDPEPQRARRARAALAPWRPRRLPVGGTRLQRLQRLRAASLRLRSLMDSGSGSKDAQVSVGILAGPLRPNSSDCTLCSSLWALDCPERCVYEFGAIEAACEGLRGVDLVFLDSDGSAADGWLVEWLQDLLSCNSK